MSIQFKEMLALVKETRKNNPMELTNRCAHLAVAQAAAGPAAPAGPAVQAELDSVAVIPAPVTT